MCSGTSGRLSNIVGSQRSNSLRDKARGRSNNLHLASLCCHRASWVFDPYRPRYVRWVQGTITMTESVSGAHRRVSTLHPYESAPPSLSPNPRPSHPTSTNPLRAMHFSSGRKALHRVRPGQRIIKNIELAPCRHPPR